MTPAFPNGRIAALSAFLFLAAGNSAVADLAAPQGQVILTVDGDITETNRIRNASFDLAMLQALPVQGFETTTTWTEGRLRFDGVPLKAVLDAVGARGGTITATALNNYSVQIPVSAIGDTVPIIAYHINGQPFSRRDKGPLWIVFPYESDSDYRTERVFGWSIWQLAGLTVSD